MTPKPIFRQFGSKNRVADQIISLLPAGKDHWVEVFAGTASVTLRKDRGMHEDEHLNDLNGNIVNLFRLLRDDAARARLCDLVSLTPWSEGEWLFCRANPEADDPIERASRYLVASWQGMAGSTRQSTGWIAIDGSNKNRNRMWRDLPLRISAVADRLVDVFVHEKHGLEILDRFGGRPDTILFIDPPYPAEAVNTRRAYMVDMSAADHEAFAARLVDVKCAVLLTMAPGTVYDQALEDWHVTPLMVRGLRHAVKEERIFTNYDPRQMGLFA